MKKSQPGDFIEDKNAVRSFDAAIHSGLRETTTRVLASLTPRENGIADAVRDWYEYRSHAGARPAILCHARAYSSDRGQSLRKLKHPRSRKLRSFLNIASHRPIFVTGSGLSLQKIADAPIRRSNHDRRHIAPSGRKIWGPVQLLNPRLITVLQVESCRANMPPSRRDAASFGGQVVAAGRTYPRPDRFHPACLTGRFQWLCPGLWRAFIAISVAAWRAISSASLIDPVFQTVWQMDAE